MEKSKPRVHTDFSTGYQWWSLRLASPNFSFRSGITHVAKMGILCFAKNYFIFALISFYKYEGCGGGRDFVLGVPRGPPNYLVLAPSFEYWLEIFQCCQKWFF